MTRTFSALVSNLWCLHWPGARVSAGAKTRLHGSGIFLDTCLRQLVFGVESCPTPPTDPAVELSTGPAAYRLLLEVASGLRSAVPGETNVFGQFRRATEQAAAQLAPEHWERLHPLVQAVQADTRALRQGHLLGMAGNSYGSLVRALLAPERDARVLFVGTGDLTRSMVPLFRAFDVGVWNHRHGAPLADVCRWFAPDEAQAAADWATHIIFTTPPDPAHDQAWCNRLRPQTLRGLVHLAYRRSDPPHSRSLAQLLWPSVRVTFNLDDVFDLASARDQHRRERLDEAARACTALVAARLGDDRPLSSPNRLARQRA